MKTLLSLLFLLVTLPAQFIGTPYGTGTPDFLNQCGQLVWHDTNNYAYGSSARGSAFNYLTVRRDWCHTDQQFHHILILGLQPANVFAAAGWTGTHDSTILVNFEVVVQGTLNATGVEYVYPQIVPNVPSLLGANVYSQWVLHWIDVLGIQRIMFSRGLKVTVT